ncbi:MAG: hypothetical protein ACXAC2_11220, partial [Candidatus Kariarchaeaceae archaeon]
TASVLFHERMYHVVYGYYTIALLVLLYYIITVTATIRPSLIIKQETLMQRTDYKLYSIVLILLLLGYVFISLIYPERGWDALQFYFPNSIYFFLEDDIPSTVNPFTFFPTFKPPSNTLFLVYSLYATKGFYAHLFPVAFLLAIVCATIIFAMDLGMTKRKAKITSIFLITTPAVYVTMLEYSFYQELPVTFFYSMGIIYYQKGQKDGKMGDYILSAFGVSLAVLSKLSGFTSILLILIIFPVLNSKYDKRVRIFILSVLGLFFARKAIFDTYFGTGILIIIITGLIIYQLIKTRDNTIQSYSSLKPGTFGILFTSFAFIVSLGIWIRHMLQFPQTMETLQNLYFERNRQSIAWDFVSIDLIGEVYLENAHSVNFLTSVFPVFIGSQFTLFLLLPKIIGLKKAYKKYPAVNLWFGSFYIFWLAYHSQTSIRYLSIIWIPLSILTVLGVEEIIKYFKVQKYSDQIYLLLIFTNFLFYYSFIPFEFIFLDYHSRLYEYHVSLFRLLIYFLTFWGAMYQILRYLSRKDGSTTDETIVKKYRRNRNVTIILLSTMIVVAPISAQIIVFTYTGFDRDEFQDIWIYDNRQEVQELVNYMIELDYNFESVTVVVNIPGLGYWLNRPVFDLMFVDEYLEVNQSSILINDDINQVYIDLRENNIDYVVTLLDGHVFYESYVERFERDYPFLATINSTFAFSMFNNTEFELWQLI